MTVAHGIGDGPMIDGSAPDVVLAAYDAHTRPGRSAHYYAAELPRASFTGETVARRIFGDHIHGRRVPFPPSLKLTRLYREGSSIIVHFLTTALVLTAGVIFGQFPRLPATLCAEKIYFIALLR